MGGRARANDPPRAPSAGGSRERSSPARAGGRSWRGFGFRRPAVGRGDEAPECAGRGAKSGMQFRRRVRIRARRRRSMAAIASQRTEAGPRSRRCGLLPSQSITSAQPTKAPYPPSACPSVAITRRVANARRMSSAPRPVRARRCRRSSRPATHRDARCASSSGTGATSPSMQGRRSRLRAPRRGRGQARIGASRSVRVAREGGARATAPSFRHAWFKRSPNTRHAGRRARQYPARQRSRQRPRESRERSKRRSAGMRICPVTSGEAPAPVRTRRSGMGSPARLRVMGEAEVIRCWRS